MRPTCDQVAPRVGRLVDTVAPAAVRRAVRFARADPHDRGIGGRDRDIADGRHGSLFEDRRPRRAAVGRLPDAARRRADVDDRAGSDSTPATALIRPPMTAGPMLRKARVPSAASAPAGQRVCPEAAPAATDVSTRASSARPVRASRPVRGLMCPLEGASEAVRPRTRVLRHARDASRAFTIHLRYRASHQRPHDQQRDRVQERP